MSTITTTTLCLTTLCVLAAPAAPTPVCQLQLTAAFDSPTGSPDSASVLASWVLTNLQQTPLQGWSLRFSLPNASLIAVTGASPVSPSSNTTATSPPIWYAPRRPHVAGSQHPHTIQRIKDAPATAVVPPNGSASFNALLRLVQPDSNAPVLLQGPSVNSLPCYALPDGLTRLALASSRAVQALPTNASCPPPQASSPPCRVDWCCPPDDAPRVDNTTPLTSAPATTATSTPAAAPAGAHKSGTPVAVPIAAACAVVAAAVVLALALRCAPHMRRRHATPTPAPADVILPHPRRLAPIVTRLLSPSSSTPSSPNPRAPASPLCSTPASAPEPHRPAPCPPPPRSNTAPLRSSGAVLPASPAQSLSPFADIDVAADVLLVERLGSGGFGTVFKGIWRGQAVAVKVFHAAIPALADPDATTLHIDESFAQEVRVLSTLQHPRVVRLLGACMRPPLFALVQELAAGSLSDLLRGRTDPLPMEQLVQIATDVAEAMVYLHPKVVHRDLKPHNVLLDADGRAMVCDFGIARLHDCTSLSTTTGGAAGTPCYMAPEMFSQERVGPAVDVFAFGIMLWQMATCQEPWSELNSPVEIIYAVGVLQQRPPVVGLPEQLASLVQRCWAHAPAARPTFVQVLEALRAMQEERWWCDVGVTTR